MIKFTGDGPKGKVLFLGLTDRNLELMRSPEGKGRPVKINGAEMGCSHDIFIFHGATEEKILAGLVAAGIQLPKTVLTHHDDDRQSGGRDDN